ncbi:MAG: addiction module protein, partial [Microcystaceae cyanobacterium]
MLMNTLLTEHIMPLTVAERLQLIEEIWDSISHNDSEILLTSPQKEEIDRRLESYHDVKNQGKSWQEIKQKFT